MVTHDRLVDETLMGYVFNEVSILELNARRVSRDVLLMANCLGYSNDTIFSYTVDCIVSAWRFLGIPVWTPDAFEYVIKIVAIRNDELSDEDKRYGFMLSAVGSCLFCLDRAVIHARRGNIERAEEWLNSAQSLRFARLANDISIQKIVGRSGGIGRDESLGYAEKRRQIREIWATGKYDKRDICAEQECAALDMSFSTARKALRNTPEPPSRCR